MSQSEHIPDEHLHHVVPWQLYVTIFVALFILTIVTVAVAFWDLGTWNPIIALGIAVTKALLVVLFFMHVRYYAPTLKMVAAAGIIWFGILVTFTMSDYLSRGWDEAASHTFIPQATVSAIEIPDEPTSPPNLPTSPPGTPIPQANATPTGNATAAPTQMPTQGPTAEPTAGVVATRTGGGEEATIQLSARDIQFDKNTITVQRGSRVVIEFTNHDAVPHNFAAYRSEAATERIFVGEIITGPNETVTYEFEAPTEPGRYFFRCDVHPDMTGQFIVE